MLSRLPLLYRHLRVSCSIPRPVILRPLRTTSLHTSPLFIHFVCISKDPPTLEKRMFQVTTQKRGLFWMHFPISTFLKASSRTHFGTVLKHFTSVGKKIKSYENEDCRTWTEIDLSLTNAWVLCKTAFLRHFEKSFRYIIYRLLDFRKLTFKCTAFFEIAVYFIQDSLTASGQL